MLARERGMSLKCRMGFDKENAGDVIEFILNIIPVGVIVFNSDLDVLFSNRQADLFSIPSIALVFSGSVFNAFSKKAFALVG